MVAIIVYRNRELCLHFTCISKHISFGDLTLDTPVTILTFKID